MKTPISVIGSLLALLFVVWLGLKVQPAPFAALPQGPINDQTIPLPQSLPAPVERFYRERYGDRVPVIKSVVMSGRATLRPFAGIPLQGRFRFIHLAGQGYRHYIETTFFGLPFLKVDERYLDGHGRMTLPGIGVSEGPEVDQAVNLGMWAELSLAPAIYLTDSRVRWEAVDDVTAVLVVPFGAGEDRFVVRFDAATGRPRFMEAMRYRSAGDPSKVLWITEDLTPAEGAGQGPPFIGAATWLDQGRPWATFTTEELVYNVDVADYIRAAGP